MKKCKNCKYWKKHTEEYNNKNFGECYCKKIEYSEDISNKEITDDMLLYWDCECYSADFETGQNFGCIHFEKNDLENKGDE